MYVTFIFSTNVYRLYPQCIAKISTRKYNFLPLRIIRRNKEILIYMYYTLYYGDNLDTVIISVRIPRRVKEKLEKMDVNMSEIIRKLLEKYIEENETRNLEKRLGRLREHLMGKIDPNLIAMLTREDREYR